MKQKFKDITVRVIAYDDEDWEEMNSLSELTLVNEHWWDMIVAVTEGETDDIP